MRLVFFGTGSFAIPALEAMAPHIALVVSQPDRPAGRGMRLRSSPVKDRASSLGLEVETPQKCRAPEVVERVKSLLPDALVVVAYGQILPQTMLDAAKRGGINLHGSLLPKYRGAAPIQRAILEGDKETGVTVMQMDKGMDTGDIIAADKLHIGPDETYGELEPRLAVLAARMAEEWTPRIVLGDYPRRAQDDTEATFAPKVEKSEARLDPVRDAETEYNRFRAFTPSPGAFLPTDWGQLRILRARLSQGNGLPCTILEVKASLTIAFAQGALELIEVRPEGKKNMAGKDFANGMRLSPGMRILSSS